jgi:DUF4097 and DUF4098 domain-containing protein YvlB
MDEKWSVDGPRIIEVGSPQQPVRQVRARLVGGRVDVVAHDDADGGARIEVGMVRGRPVEVRYADGVLDVGHPQLTWENVLDRIRGAFLREDAAEISIAVPRDAAVLLGTVSADGLVSGVRRDTEVRTVSGTIVLDGVRGMVKARTVSGQIDARDHEGVFSGDSVSGSLTVEGAAIPRLHAKTVSGEVGVDLRAAAGPSRLGPGAVLDVGTVSGDVTVRVPPGTGYEVTARSVSGRVVAGNSRLNSSGGPTRGRLVDGDAAVKLVAKTVSGNVTLVRASAEGGTA